MLLNFKVKAQLFIVFSLIISNLYSAVPKLKKEQKIYEEIKQAGLLPHELSGIISNYLASRSILLNFLIPNLKGSLIFKHENSYWGKENIDKILNKYPKLRSDLKIVSQAERTRITTVLEPLKDYAYLTKEEDGDESGDNMWIRKVNIIPLSSNMIIPIYYKMGGLKVGLASISIDLEIEGKKNKYIFYLSSDSFGSQRTNLPDKWYLDGGNFSIKLIEDFKAECKDKSEFFVKSSEDPNFALCIRKIS